MKRPRLLFLVLILIVIFEAGLLLKNKLNLGGFTAINPQTHSVNLAEEGFSPAEITINKGDAVIFTTTRGKQFWPASNLHPTHGIYPEFDPKVPIEPNSSWQFTFTKSGEWKYHDHLAPLYRGVITVSNKKSETDCGDVTGNQKLICFENLVDKTLKEKGLGQAFETLASLYQVDTSFAASCHDFAHKLGQTAYQLFSESKDFQLSDKSSYCGYGFYHGFMETLLQTTGDMDQARAFCEYADEQLKITTSDTGGACYHGIGHGAVDGGDPRLWGDAQAMIAPSLELCEKVSSDENPPPRYGKLFRCTSGAFNGLEILIDSSKYKLSPNREDPFWVCRLQPTKYQEACYTQFVVAAMLSTGGDFEKTTKIIDTISEDSSAIPSLQALVVERARVGKTNYQETLSYCRGLANRFQVPCTTAFAEGFLKYGPPQDEYTEAVNFCSSKLLTEREKQACFERVLSLLRIFYTAEKSSQICQSVDNKYRWNGCKYN